MMFLTIFLLCEAEEDRPVLDEAKRVYEAQVVRVDSSVLAERALVAVASGPVICIVESDRDAGGALRLGVDEILRAGEVTTRTLAGAVERARTRAAVRASPEYRHALLDQDDEAVFATLGAALGMRLETPLAMASVDCAAVADAINCLIEVDDQFLAWTALVAPSEQLRSLIARRLTAPTAAELKRVMLRLRASIGRAESLVRLLRELSLAGGVESPVMVSPLLTEIADIMRSVIDPWADLTVEGEAVGVVAELRQTVVVATGVLLANALDSIRAADRGRGTISVRTFEQEDAVLIEVRDNGREISNDLRPSIFEQNFSDSTNRRGLGRLRDRLRRAGGEMLVDSDATGSAIRVFLPSLKGHERGVLPASGHQFPMPRKIEN